MPRPRICRRIGFNEKFFNFVPRGIKSFEESVLSLDEFEAIRLVDMENLEQGKAASKMKISQPTLSRILKTARKKISKAIIEGHAIKIEGGTYKMAQPKANQRFPFARQDGQARGRGLGLGAGRGLGIGPRGRMGGVRAGPGGVCKCLKCGYTEPQVRGQPCTAKKCPKCGDSMIRA
jgi:uncharacterized protein